MRRERTAGEPPVAPAGAPGRASESARRSGSWPALIVAAGVFVALFVLQRGRSTFLAVDAQRAAAARLAQEYGLEIADVLTLRDLVGPHAPDASWRELAALLAERRREFGDERAIELVAGDPVAARRFVLLRERFARRAGAAAR